MNKLFIVFLLTLTLGLSAQTSEKWGLKKCIEYALDHNVSIQQSEIQGQILDNNLTQAKLSRIPSLNGSGSHNYNIGRAIDPFTNTFSTTTIQSNSFSLNSGVLIYGGSQVNNRIKQSKKAVDANSEGKAVIRNQIALSVATTFLQILQAEESLKVSSSQKEITEIQLERANKLVKNGASNKSTVLTLKAQLANDQANIINTQNSIQIGYNALMNLMQLPLDQPFQIANATINQIPEIEMTTVKEIYELALSNLPEIKQAKLQIQQNQLGEKIASASLQPTLSGYGNINTVYSQSGKEVSTSSDLEIIPIGITETTQETVVTARPITLISDKAFGKQLSDNLGQQVGVSLSIPVFNGYRNKTTSENAKLNTQLSELSLENTKNQLRNDVTSAFTNQKASKSRYDAAQASEEAQRLNYDFIAKRHAAGVANDVDLLTAKNQWNQALTQVVNAKYEYVFRTLIIDFYKGKELKL